MDTDFDALARQTRTTPATPNDADLYSALAALPLWYVLKDQNAPGRVVQWSPCLPAFTDGLKAEAFAREAGLLDHRGNAGVIGVQVAHAVAWMQSLRTQGLTWACFNLGRSSVDFPLYFQHLDDALFTSRRPAVDPAPGDLVSVATGDGLIAVAKVLAVDDKGIHIRLYALRLDHRPRGVSLDQLCVERYVPGEAPRSFAHIPLNRATFLQWLPETLDSGLPLSREELLGYQLWQRDGGGCF